MMMTGKEITKPKVGVIPDLKPAYIGRNKPNNTYKPVMISPSTKLETVKPIIKTIRSCNETLMLSPNGRANIPIIQSRAK